MESLGTLSEVRRRNDRYTKEGRTRPARKTNFNQAAFDRAYLVDLVQTLAVTIDRLITTHAKPEWDNSRSMESEIQRAKRLIEGINAR